MFVFKIYDAFIKSNLSQLFHPFDLTHSITMSFAVLHTFLKMSLTVGEFYLNTQYLWCFLKKKKKKDITEETSVAMNSQHCAYMNTRILKSRTCPKYIVIKKNKQTKNTSQLRCLLLKSTKQIRFLSWQCCIICS